MNTVYIFVSNSSSISEHFLNTFQWKFLNNSIIFVLNYLQFGVKQSIIVLTGILYGFIVT